MKKSYNIPQTDLLVITTINCMNSGSSIVNNTPAPPDAIGGAPGRHRNTLIVK